MMQAFEADDLGLPEPRERGDPSPERCVEEDDEWALLEYFDQSFRVTVVGKSRDLLREPFSAKDLPSFGRMCMVTVVSLAQ